jgi:hypothetical protein
MREAIDKCPHIPARLHDRHSRAKVQSQTINRPGADDKNLQSTLRLSTSKVLFQFNLRIGFLSMTNQQQQGDQKQQDGQQQQGGGGQSPGQQTQKPGEGGQQNQEKPDQQQK